MSIEADKAKVAFQKTLKEFSSTGITLSIEIQALCHAFFLAGSTYGISLVIDKLDTLAEKKDDNLQSTSSQSENKQ